MGFVQHFLNQHFIGRSHGKVTLRVIFSKKTLETKKKKERVRISVRHLESAFIALGIGSLLSTWILGVEILYYKMLP